MSSWNRYIKDFVSYLKIEKGLAENSVQAYTDDVIKLKDFAEVQSVLPEAISLQFLQQFILELYDLGLSARSQARIISGIKQFFTFLVIDDIIETDPSELLELPRIGRKLPEVLTIEEIDLTGVA